MSSSRPKLAGEEVVNVAAARAEIDESGLSALDARWIVALRAGALLEGGRAAIMTPASRAYVVELGREMGLGAFDTSLIVAIVQEAARRGEGVGQVRTRALVGMIAPARSTQGPRGAWVVYGVGLACVALVLGVFYARLMTG